MESILLLAHTEADGSLGRPALEALAAAKNLGGELHIGLVGAQVQQGADQVAGAGAARILAVSGEAFGQSRYATDAAAAEALCRASGAALVLAPSTSRWSRALPGVAFRLGGRVDTHATALAIENGVPAVTRWFYRQRMEAVQMCIRDRLGREIAGGIGPARRAVPGGRWICAHRGGIGQHQRFDRLGRG